jgi:class 3 adenylate cyclase
LTVAEFPAGAVTFLFTDVEGSTRLLKQLREGYDDVLREHQRLLQEAFAQYGGRVVDTQGDSFFVAFGSARAAVLAAVQGQRALAEHEWPEGTQVKVRMGIHTGQAAVSEERYVGLSVPSSTARPSTWPSGRRSSLSTAPTSSRDEWATTSTTR